MTLGRYSTTDYASAVRRSSLFDGYAGFSIYSSISQGLDEITYGGRRSRRGSISESTNHATTTSAYSFSSRRGSVTATNSVDYAALMAATAALEATSVVYKAAGNDQSESGLGNSPKSINLSRQNSTRYIYCTILGQRYLEITDFGTKIPYNFTGCLTCRIPPMARITNPLAHPAD